MPTYDYECQACGHTFERFQQITAGALRKCPECKKLKLRRLIGTGGGIIFKGSGFYETDYKRKSGGGGKGESSGSESSLDAKVEKGKEAAKKDAPSKDAKKKD